MPSRKSVLLGVAACFFGAIAGFLVLLWCILIARPAHPGEEGLELIGWFVIGSPIAVIGGGVAGILFVAFAVRRTWSTAKIAATGGAVALVLAILYLVRPAVEDRVDVWHDARTREQIDRYVTIEEQRSEDMLDDLAASIPHDESSVAKVLGPLEYPNSRFVSWTESREYSVGVWTIILATDDHPDDVLGYYASVLPDGMPGYDLQYAPGPKGDWEVSSRQFESKDGRRTSVHVEGTDASVQIRFRSAINSWGGGYTAAEKETSFQNPWPDDLVAQYKAERDAHYAVMLESQAQWLYPGATFVWGDLAKLANVGFNTPDDLETVTRFYHAKNRVFDLTTDRRVDFGNAQQAEPDICLHPIPTGTRIHFRQMR